MKKKIFAIVLTVVLAASLLTGFAKSGKKGSAETDSTGELVEFTGNGGKGASTTKGVNVELSADLPDKAYEDDIDKKDADAVITLNKTSVKVDGTGAKASGSTVTISAKGIYYITGTLQNGSIIIDNKNGENIRLVLDGADITSKSGPCIKVNDAKNVFVIMKNGTKNTLTCTDAESAAIDSQTDIYFGGSGSLDITAAKDGITSKDDIGIAGGTIRIKAEDDGITGKDSVQIADGNITVDATDDCIKSSKDDDPEKGFVVIDGGQITLSSKEGKGVKSVYAFVMNDGKLTVTGCDEGIQSLNIVQNGGTIDITSNDDGINVTDKTASANAAATQGSAERSKAASTQGTAKKSGSSATQGSAKNTSASQNRTDNTNRSGPQNRPENADTPMQRPGDMQKPAGQNAPSGNMIRERRLDMQGQANRPEKMQGQNGMMQKDFMQRPDRMQGQNGMMPGQGMGGRGTFENIDGCVVINGGTLKIRAGGDGIDSNGDILVNGGTVYVYGPIHQGDGAIDMNGVYEQNGGKVYIPQNAGMMEF